MKKVLVVCLICMFSLALVGYAAAITGPCSGCHTMHNSQNGSTEQLDGSANAQPHLLKGSCLVCHGITGTPASGAPNVFGAAVNTELAGGTFNDAAAVANVQTKRHDVSDIVNFAAYYPSLDTNFTDSNTTPGMGSAGRTTTTPTNLTCAGTTGCHGDPGLAGSDNAIKGSHHGSPAVVGYRFLRTQAGGVITGKGSVDWELATTLGDGNHNVYSSATGVGISALCADCHGGFHGSIETDSDVGDNVNWIRHPVETVVSGVTGYVEASFSITNWSSSPVGYETISNLYSTATTNMVKASAEVICVSCHRAHGSEYADILRFNYGAQVAGGGSVTTGCLNCHMSQR